MIRVGKLSNDEIILAFLNNFVGYSAFERKRLMQEHIRRTLRELGVKERYKLVPDRETGQFSCDDRKRIIRCNPGFIESGPRYPGVYAYLLICHECVHAKQNEEIRKIDRGLAEKNSIYLNQMGKVPPVNEWARYPTCGYIDAAASRKLSKRKNTVASLELAYRLQPAEYEAYSFQYKNANKLADFVSRNHSELINPNFVLSKLRSEISGYKEMVIMASRIFLVENPQLEMDKALWKMFNGEKPQTYSECVFQLGAMLTYDMLKSGKNFESILELTDEVRFEQPAKSNKTNKSSTKKESFAEKDCISNERTLNFKNKFDIEK